MWFIRARYYSTVVQRDFIGIGHVYWSFKVEKGFVWDCSLNEEILEKKFMYSYWTFDNVVSHSIGLKLYRKILSIYFLDIINKFDSICLYLFNILSFLIDDFRLNPRNCPYTLPSYFISDEEEDKFLRLLSEATLYLLLPPSYSSNNTLRHLLREIFVFKGWTYRRKKEKTFNLIFSSSFQTNSWVNQWAGLFQWEYYVSNRSINQ